MTKHTKKYLFRRFTKAINDYEMIKPGDKICVCISGGKDSFLLATLFKELKKQGVMDFEVTYIVMDPGYTTEVRNLIESNAKLLEIPVSIYETDIFENTKEIKDAPCYVCARMRRGYLYDIARKAGCNKIALGHHYDDVIETILMGMLYGAQVQTMMPKLKSTSHEGMELIRPLYYVREEDIIYWRDNNNYEFIQCACALTRGVAAGTMSSKRKEIKELIRELKKTNPFVEQNIFGSVCNVNLNTLISYQRDGVKHHFLDDYDEHVVKYWED